MGVASRRITHLSLGSNLGDREANIRAAVDQLSTELRILQVSSIYETAPLGVVDQPQFFNIALEAETILPPLGLLTRLKEIEEQLGREPSYHWGPRVIDIDIILFGRLHQDTAELVIPHAAMMRRAFVLVPLVEIAPNEVHPVIGLSVSRLLDDVSGRETVRKVKRY
ncbi:MAG: 2-amino-4-hydroxy-6-hydroxymethyldihydropteridine diphosphokinase [Chloroflexi bacterium]|nr:MAG: 2-amino-4-hydroxy-6-hydroxymethyldihydropteridine diphosphokinase [Chloroflexota bacterium]